MTSIDKQRTECRRTGGPRPPHGNAVPVPRSVVATPGRLCIGLARRHERIDHRQINLEPVSVWYPTESATTPDRVATLRDWAARELGTAFIANGLEIADSPGQNTMIVRIQFIDFTDTPVSAQALAWKRRFAFDVEPGHVTMVAELIDASTGDTVVRMADMQNEAASGLSDDLHSALTGWSHIVATTVVSPVSEVQLANR